VLELQPYTRIAYSWQTNSMVDGKPYDSMVTWTLTPTGQGTKLQLVHDRFVALEDQQAHDQGWAEIGRRFTALLSNTANVHANP
jgi:uncharacterized protein YndB with AHSA1/START domain